MTLQKLRAAQEAEKLTLLRLKRQKEERCLRRRQRDRFDDLSEALSAATETSPRPFGP